MSREEKERSGPANEKNKRSFWDKGGCIQDSWWDKKTPEDHDYCQKTSTRGDHYQRKGKKITERKKKKAMLSLIGIGNPCNTGGVRAQTSKGKDFLNKRVTKNHTTSKNPPARAPKRKVMSPRKEKGRKSQ